MNTRRRTLSALAACALAVCLARPVAAAALANRVVQDGLRYARRVDLGIVPIGRSVTTVGQLENVGSSPLWIQSLSPTCGCTVAEWSPRALAPGDIARPVIGIEGEDQRGHFRHLVAIIGVDGRPLGEIVVTADAQEEDSAAGPFWPADAAVELGAFRPHERTEARVKLEGTVPGGALELAWTAQQGGLELGNGQRLVQLEAGQGQLEATLSPPPAIWGAMLHLRALGSEQSVPLQGYPMPDVGDAHVGMELDGLRLEGVRDVEGDPYLDFGQLALGQSAVRQLRLRNTSLHALTITRIFTGSDEDLAIEGGAGSLAPGAEATASVTFRGRARPGSFRKFVHVLAEGAHPLRVRIGCIGFVQPPARGGWGEGVVALQIGLQRDDCPTVTLADQDANLLASVPTLDHQHYGRWLRGAVRWRAAVCSNCAPPGPTTAEPPPCRQHLSHGGQAVDVFSVLGDEAIDGAAQQLLPWLLEPNGAVIRALHPEGFDEDHPTSLPVVVFHDDAPLAEEAARRTRVPAVFVVAGSGVAEASVRALRGVLLFTPAGAGMPFSHLTVYVRDSQILYWELSSKGVGS